MIGAATAANVGTAITVVTAVTSHLLGASGFAADAREFLRSFGHLARVTQRRDRQNTLHARHLPY